ncbi:MAG: glycogen debranching enzyme family protein, partial [Anaerolineae bacterium]|nr:glycogen debranching enzyme family protein [Anaerolineae bacterium]
GDYALFAEDRGGDSYPPEGFRHIDGFHLDGAIPVWDYALADALLEQRVWMQQGQNTTTIRYTLRRASGPVALTLTAMVSARDSHENLHAVTRPMRVDPVPNGLHVTAQDDSASFVVLSNRAEAAAGGGWRRDHFLGAEAERGLDALDDHFEAGAFSVTLQPGESVTIIASTEPNPPLDAEAALEGRRKYEAALIARSPLRDEPPFIRQLLLAADQFIVRRTLDDGSDGASILAGFPWFSDWGRDTMISLPGLTLATGRPELAAQILRTFARYVDRGMLPNRFPDSSDAPEYNTVDATLWYFEAIRATHAATGDDALLAELFPILDDIIAWHVRGTRYGIGMDAADGLLRQGEPGVQLTWMDVKIGEWVVTPRTGKPVEINALWINALRCMGDFAARLGRNGHEYARLAERAEVSFDRFWNEETGCCFDVIDAPDGRHDPAIRPNQVIAAALPYAPFTQEQTRQLVDVCGRELLTSYGLRSLSPRDPAYIGQFTGDQPHRDAAYHQGTVWSWPIGSFALAHYKAHGDKAAALGFLDPFAEHLHDAGLGSISENFEGDAPHLPKACIAQAWGVAEVLRAWWALQER